MVFDNCRVSYHVCILFSVVNYIICNLLFWSSMLYFLCAFWCVRNFSFIFFLAFVLLPDLLTKSLLLINGCIKMTVLGYLPRRLEKERTFFTLLLLNVCHHGTRSPACHTRRIPWLDEESERKFLAGISGRIMAVHTVPLGLQKIVLEFVLRNLCFVRVSRVL